MHLPQTPLSIRARDLESEMVNVIVESPRGTCNKFKYDQAEGREFRPTGRQGPKAAEAIIAESMRRFEESLNGILSTASVSGGLADPNGEGGDGDHLAESVAEVRVPAHA